jgi:hypothetical protein
MFLIFHQGRIMKKFATILASLLLVLNLVACTSGDSKEEEGADGAVVEDLSGDPLAQGEEGLPTEGGDASASAGGEGFMDEQLPEDALGEAVASPTETPATDAPPADPLALDAPADGSLTAESTPPPDVGDLPPLEESTPLPDTAAVDVGGSALDTMEPPTDSTSSMDSSSSTAGLGDTPTEEAPKPKASLKKVDAMPMNRDGLLLNAVYVARPGDTFNSISTMIYGTADRAGDLKKANSWIKKPKPGNKIYYNSPVRPTDDTKMATYYEDAGMSPEIYVAKEGDNIRSISKDLLGYDNAWQEIWATNTVESKGSLSAGTELRYWKAAPSAPPAMPTADVAMNTPPPMDSGSMPPADLPPPPADMAMAPPPPMPPANELPPPPPPPPAEAVNPPPPPEPKAVAEISPDGEEMDKDVVMSFAGAGVVVLGLAAIMVARKRRQQRDMSNTFNDTQVGT